MSVGTKVYTPLGQGKIVHLMGDGSPVVEFEGGWGKVFAPGEIFDPDKERKRWPERPRIDSLRRCVG